MNIKCTVSALAIAMSFATQASAVTITSVSGNWTDATATGSGNLANSINTDTLSWGKAPKNSAQSSYNFSGAATPFDAQEGQVFELGSFTHANNPIYRNSQMLTSAELTLSFTIAGVDQAFTSVFNFEHYETPNDSKVCANGDLRKAGGVNKNGCADRVTFSLNKDKSETFTVGFMEYALDVTGFLDNGTLSDTFWTTEKQDNTATLMASYRLISDNTPPPVTPPAPTPSEVPLPASGLLLLGGLGAMYAKRRKS